jgi:hypothetical protein
MGCARGEVYGSSALFVALERSLKTEVQTLSRRRTATGAGRSEAEAEALSLSLWGRVGMEKVCKVRDGGKEMRAVRVVWDGCRVCVWREDASHLRRDGDDFEIDVDGLEGACK